MHDNDKKMYLCIHLFVGQFKAAVLTAVLITARLEMFDVINDAHGTQLGLCCSCVIKS